MGRGRLVFGMSEWSRHLGLPLATLWRWRGIVSDLVGLSPYDAEQMRVILRAGLASRARARGWLSRLGVLPIERALERLEEMLGETDDNG